jgi:hypothetical protein
MSVCLSGRYWFHLMEFAYFFHHLISSLELKQSVDLEFHGYFDEQQSSREKAKQRKHQFNSLKRQQQPGNEEDVIGASLDDTMMLISEEQQDIENEPVGGVPKNLRKESEERNPSPTTKKSKFPEGWKTPLYNKKQLEQFQVLFCLLEQSTEAIWLFLSSKASLSLRNTLKMNLLSLLTSSYFLSSSSSSSSDFHRERTWNPEETEPQATMKTKKNDRKAATSTTTTTGDLSNLTFSTFLTMKQGGRGDDQPTAMKSTMSDYQLLEEPQWTLDNHMTYTISDLLDGSVFLY